MGMTDMPMPDISREIWDMKYRLKDRDGTPIDADPDATRARLARALAAAETPESRPAHEAAFLGALAGDRFLPAGRIIAGADADRDVTLFNCFVMGTIPDDLSGIFEHLREAALTLQAGGGIGYDFSTLRPKGALVWRVGADASGPVTFMDVWDSMCRTIMSAGHRRGAMMATLRCDHPDIEDFIAAKADPRRLRMFNLSVLVTDAFMGAVDANADWDLIFDGKKYRTVRARDLWDKIMRSTYDHAEPGVIFIDRINARNNLAYCETIAATNPCGEEPLPPYGACLLGSVNLARFVERPFQEDAALDEPAFEATVRTAVRMLDNAIDVSRFPLPAQKAEAEAKRRIGLGVTGLADALAMLRVRYGSDRAVALTRDWLGLLQRTAYLASVDLAREKGAFPLFDRDAYLAGETVAGLDDDVREGIAAHGIRNALLTAIAPTGTISLLAGNVSSGIEPVFAFSFRRKVLMPDGTRREQEVSDYAVRLYRHLHGADADLPDYFVDTAALTPAEHVAMQAAAQDHVDAAISKTINVPEDIAFADFRDVYRRAWDGGCKGCTTYRPNDVTGAVLSATPEAEPDAETDQPELPLLQAAEKPAAPPARSAEVISLTQPLARPETLVGATYKLRWPESDHAIYITINDVETGGRRRPFEVFINSKNMNHYAWTVALTRMISAVFRRGGDVSFVVEELKAVFDPRGGQWMAGRYVPSLLAAIGEVVENHMKAIGFIAGDDAPSVLEAAALPDGRTARRAPAPCPRCSQPGLVHQEGCDRCNACGYSSCA